MKISKACTIFENIGSPDFTDLEKSEAVYEVIKMPTHNSITKDKMLSVIIKRGGGKNDRHDKSRSIKYAHPAPA